MNTEKDLTNQEEETVAETIAQATQPETTQETEETEESDAE